ncbi:hypothetical protein KFU94_36160, partial [Chloroflexi bacterium TSY]|nr:hypothetical protein [Chloroflexi bacterium TSY]
YPKVLQHCLHNRNWENKKAAAFASGYSVSCPIKKSHERWSTVALISSGVSLSTVRQTARIDKRIQAKRIKVVWVI